MADAPNPLLLMRLARQRRVPTTPDPADMGTAFGLDYILDEAASRENSVEGTPSEPGAWYRRWLPGGKPAR